MKFNCCLDEFFVEGVLFMSLGMGEGFFLDLKYCKSVMYFIVG